MKTDNGEFEKETIKVYRDVADDGQKGQTEIAVVRWIKDGRAFAPQLANQEVYFDKLDRKKKYGKMKGLKYADLKLIQDNLPEIMALVGDVQPRAKDTQKAAANDVERDPFED